MHIIREIRVDFLNASDKDDWMRLGYLLVWGRYYND